MSNFFAHGPFQNYLGKEALRALVFKKWITKSGIYEILLAGLLKATLRPWQKVATGRIWPAGRTLPTPALNGVFWSVLFIWELAFFYRLIYSHLWPLCRHYIVLDPNLRHITSETCIAKLYKWIIIFIWMYVKWERQRMNIR